MAPFSIKTGIAGIVTRITSEFPFPNTYLDQFALFKSISEPAAALQVRKDAAVPFENSKKKLVYNSGSGWKLHEDGDLRIYTFFSSSNSFKVGMHIATFDSEWKQGEFILPAQNTGSCPLGPPFFDVWYMSLLGKGRGLLLHGCGVSDQGRGFLFLGEPEAGKSTLARLWHPHAQVLSDERVVLREIEGQLWIFGTPWHSSFKVFSPLGAPLEKVFFIRHAQQSGHNAVRLGSIETATRMLKNAILPIWDAPSMDFSLGLVGRLCENIHCWDLAFSPDESVREYVRCVS
jgi:hypothetical protein